MQILEARSFEQGEFSEHLTEDDQFPADLLDESDGSEDGDDSIHGDGKPKGALMLLSPTFPSSAAGKPFKHPAMIVPLKREIKKNVRGNDVVAMKRALSHAGYLKWPKRWDKRCGDKAVAAIRKFQRDHAIKVDGVYGKTTHRRLVKLGHYDAWGAYLMRSQKVTNESRVDHARAKLVAHAMYGYHTRDRIHYSQAVRMQIVRFKLYLPWFARRTSIFEDCSSFVTGLYFDVGIPDPNGNRYNGFGYTGTLANHGRQTLHALPGDLGLYGPRSIGYEHVVIMVNGGLCVSHGSERGPLLLNPFYRNDFSHWRTYL